ncbi:MAG: GNAT family N-acetyltransferase [Planctomycetaceae bacterium]|nr:GNAT family N-acetyltransferase [Planctomycetaceae bacterium]
MKEMLQIRKATSSDNSTVMDFVAATGFFRPVEIEIANEVLTEAAEGKPACTYQSYVGILENKPVGWICFGCTPCTLGTFDVYWIAVDPAYQRHHIGSQLLSFVEGEIRKQKGRLIVIETSGSEQYLPTRGFYERNGYTLSATVKDFYAPGDDRWIFTKAEIS